MVQRCAAAQRQAPNVRRWGVCACGVRQRARGGGGFVGGAWVCCSRSVCVHLLENCPAAASRRARAGFVPASAVGATRVRRGRAGGPGRSARRRRGSRGRGRGGRFEPAFFAFAALQCVQRPARRWPPSASSNLLLGSRLSSDSEEFGPHTGAIAYGIGATQQPPVFLDHSSTGTR